MTVRILHVSDSLVAADTPAVEGLQRAVATALTREVDVVVHTGTLLRRPTPDGADVEAVASALEPLVEAGIPCYVVAGPREAAGETDSLARLAEEAPVERLGATPTYVEDTVALYGIDRGPDLETALAGLVDEDLRTHNLLCLHRELTPPLNPYAVDLQPFELTDHSAVFLNGVLAGGSDDPREWVADEHGYHVSYPGTTNPEVADEPGDRPSAALVTVHSADEAEREVLELRPGGVDEGSDGDADAGAQVPPDDEPAAQSDATTSTGGEAPPGVVTPEEEMAPLLALLDYDEAPLADAETETLADLYGLLSQVKGLLDDRRKEVGEALEARLAADEEFTGRYATVRRTRSTRRSPKDDETVFRALEAAGVDRDAVLGIDSSKLRDLADSGEVPEDAVFDREERTYIRRQDLSVEE
jgi:hypothetical protein